MFAFAVILSEAKNLWIKAKGQTESQRCFAPLNMIIAANATAR
jgi:hypothetical protein